MTARAGTGRIGGERVIAAKLTLPALPPPVVVRPRLLSLFEPAARVNLLVAPPGYGKSVAARQFAGASGVPTAWLSVDLLDSDPISFWVHLLAAVRTVIPEIDGEPEAAVAENPWSANFMAVLLWQIEQTDARVLLVIDDVDRLADTATLDRLALLVDRVGDRLQLCMTARSAPRLPLARWHTHGWLQRLTADDLRFREDEAWAVATATAVGRPLDPARVQALNHRVEGWPIAFALTVLSPEDPEAVDGTGDGSGAGRHLTDYVDGEVLGHLDPAAREVALVLSVVDWFDADVVAALAGSHASRTVPILVANDLATPVPAGPPGRLRFHRLVRELLDAELRWVDPVRHAELHRGAADLAIARDEIGAAHRHLLAAGDTADANALLVEPVLALVDRGDLAGIGRLVGSFPARAEVGDAALALDIALSLAHAGSGEVAGAWCDRGEALGAVDGPATRLRLRAVRSVVAFDRGDVGGAAGHVREVERLLDHGMADAGSVDRRFATHAAAVAIAAQDSGGVRRWLDWLRRAGAPRGRLDSEVCEPVLAAAVDLLAGRVVAASTWAAAACAAADEMDIRPHPAACEALVIAASCHLALGELPLADECAAAARHDAELLGRDRLRALAGAAAAKVCLELRGPDDALGLILEVAAGISDAAAPALSQELDLVKGSALLRVARRDEARALVESLPRSPRSALVLAALAVADGHTSEVGTLLAGSSGWRVAERLEAVVLAAAAGISHGPAALHDGLVEGAASGWVSPFIGHGPRIEAMLLAQPLERTHPRLLEHLRAVHRAGAIAHIDLVDPITPREQTILELLPSHLSYAQIGERLFLSVNTVKSNLKSIYRKLGVATRDDAVQTARAGGLL